MNQRLFPCPRCGWQFPEGMAQCPQCGAPGFWRFQQAPQGFLPGFQQGQWQCQAPPPKKSSWKKWTLIGLLVFFGLAALGSGKDRQKGYETAESPAPAEQSYESAPVQEPEAQNSADAGKAAEASAPQEKEKDPCAHVQTMSDWERMSYARRLAYPQCMPGRGRDGGGKDGAGERLETVSASKLAADFSANEVAAEERWNGRKIRVSGTVDSIDTGVFGGVKVWLRTPGRILGVLCSLDDSQRSAAAKLRKGQMISVVGTVRGATLKSPSLRDCVLE